MSADELGALQRALHEAQEILGAVRTASSRDSAAAAERPFHVFVQGMQEGAVTLSPDGLILYCNPRFAEMLLLPLDKVTGSNIADYLPVEAWTALAGIFSTGKPHGRLETVLANQAATARPVMLTASRIDGASPLLCIVVTDLVAQKEKEDLRNAKENAERASAAKDEFLASLSHELRTPLAPALMAATVLEKDASLPEAARSDISLIRRNVELEARLIDDLLDLTLITRGRLTLQSEEVNLHAILNRALETCQVEARQKRINLRIELGARKTRINGDPVRMQQVFWNVLRNAIKFTPERGNIVIATGDEAGGVWVRISDSGIGFEPDSAERIFEAFEQGSRHVTRRFGGLGLGLAISRSIMSAHGGRIEAHSAGINHGSTFTLHFPLAAPEANRGEGALPAAPAARGEALNILLVEDHKDTRACLQRVLEASAHKVASAGSGQAALDLASQSRFDLVISDLGLPDISGHKLMRELHDRFGLPGVALSGYGMENDVENSRAAGFRHHLTKPVSFDRLRAVVAEFAGQS